MHVLVCVLLAILVGCATPGEERPAETATGTAKVPAPPRIDFSDPRDKPSVLPLDGYWRAAQSDDPMDLAALANAAGAELLLQEAARGSRAGLLALHALPFAPDSSEVLTAVCAWIPRVSKSDRVELLTVLHEMFRVSRPSGNHRGKACRSQLRWAVRQEQIPDFGRDLASSMLSTLELDRAERRESAK